MIAIIIGTLYTYSAYDYCDAEFEGKSSQTKEDLRQRFELMRLVNIALLTVILITFNLLLMKKLSQRFHGLY